MRVVSISPLAVILVWWSQWRLTTVCLWTKKSEKLSRQHTIHYIYFITVLGLYYLRFIQKEWHKYLCMVISYFILNYQMKYEICSRMLSLYWPLVSSSIVLYLVIALIIIIYLLCWGFSQRILDSVISIFLTWLYKLSRRERERGGGGGREREREGGRKEEREREGTGLKILIISYLQLYHCCRENHLLKRIHNKDYSHKYKCHH